MLIFNPISTLLQLEISKYLFGAFFLFGATLCLKLLIFKKGL